MNNDRIDMFEHLKDPIEEMNLEVTYRLWRSMPYFMDILTQRMIDLLKEKNFWKLALKHDLTRAANIISPASKQLMEDLIKREDKNFLPLNFETAMCEKFMAAFIEYYRRMVDLAKVSEAPTKEEKDLLYKKYMVDRAVFMIALKPGDIFTFLDTGRYEEFTYKGFHTCRGEVICDYINYNSKNPMLLHCENVYKPVLRQTIE